MERTTYNADAFKNHPKSRLKEQVFLDKKEQSEILRHISELKDMYDNDELVPLTVECLCSTDI